MVRLLLFFCFLTTLTTVRAQETPKDTGTTQVAGVVAWKNVQPEKLDASELMILPSNRFLRLNLKEDLGYTRVIIQDLNGNTLLEKPYDPGRDLDISTLKPGNYFIKVIGANRVLQGKFGKRSY